MPLVAFLYVLGLVLAILAALPPLRAFFLLNVAVVVIAIGLVLQSGAIQP